MRGWKALTVLLGLIVILCGIGCWALITWLTPLVIPTGQIWPGGLTDLWMWLCLGSTFAGIILGFTIDYSPMWTNRLPLMSDAGSAASNTGAAAGAVAAAVSIATADQAEPLAILIVSAVAVVLIAMAWRKVRSAVRETRAHNDNITRVKQLHASGTQTRADVINVEFQHFWLGRSPLFEVTAEYDTPSGRKRGEGRVYTSAEDAPTPGGTVLVWFAADGQDTENIDIVQDPDSIREPGAAKAYEAPSDV